MGGGKYWTLPFGNEGRGTRVYLWPLTTMGVFVLILLFVDHCLQ
jgi:hypothetical protein